MAVIALCDLPLPDRALTMAYHNSFASSLPTTQANVSAVVAVGLARRNIQNENNNMLKTKGYHFVYNFGHGQLHVASMLLSLMVLAYFQHIMLQRLDARCAVLCCALQDCSFSQGVVQ